MRLRRNSPRGTVLVFGGCDADPAVERPSQCLGGAEPALSGDGLHRVVAFRKASLRRLDTGPFDVLRGG